MEAMEKITADALAKAVDIIVTETRFNPGHGTDARESATMLVEVAYHDWCAERTYVDRESDLGPSVTTSEERAFRSLLGWGVDVGNAYRILACFRVAQGKVEATRSTIGQFANI
jgi:hypothetical protein